MDLDKLVHIEDPLEKLERHCRRIVLSWYDVKEGEKRVIPFFWWKVSTPYEDQQYPFLILATLINPRVKYAYVTDNEANLPKTLEGLVDAEAAKRIFNQVEIRSWHLRYTQEIHLIPGQKLAIRHLDVLEWFTVDTPIRVNLILSFQTAEKLTWKKEYKVGKQYEMTYFSERPLPRNLSWEYPMFLEAYEPCQVSITGILYMQGEEPLYPRATDPENYGFRVHF